jgi:hypothetical protein
LGGDAGQSGDGADAVDFGGGVSGGSVGVSCGVVIVA